MVQKQHIGQDCCYNSSARFLHPAHTQRKDSDRAIRKLIPRWHHCSIIFTVWIWWFSVQFPKGSVASIMGRSSLSLLLYLLSLEICTPLSFRLHVLYCHICHKTSACVAMIFILQQYLVSLAAKENWTIVFTINSHLEIKIVLKSPTRPREPNRSFLSITLYSTSCVWLLRCISAPPADRYKNSSTASQYEKFMASLSAWHVLLLLKHGGITFFLFPFPGHYLV